MTHVLVIDSDPSRRESLITALKNGAQDMEIEGSEDGEEAYARIVLSNPDLIIAKETDVECLMEASPYSLFLVLAKNVEKSSQLLTCANVVDVISENVPKTIATKARKMVELSQRCTPVLPSTLKLFEAARANLKEARQTLQTHFLTLG